MFNLDAITNKNDRNDDKKLPSGSGKSNTLHNLIRKKR